MTHYEEKAKELINKMYQVNDIMGNYPMCFDTSKKCALILVDEIILELDDLFEMERAPCINSSWEYWQQVKLEIEKL